MKKIFTILLIISLMLCCTLSMNSCNKDDKEDVTIPPDEPTTPDNDDLKWLNFELSGEYYYVTGYTGSGKSIKIPATYKGKEVRIKEGAFFGISGIESFSFHYTQDIEFSRFFSITNSTIPTLPKNVTISGGKVIPPKAFSSTAIESIVICDGVEVIGDEAFSECENLKTLTIPDTVKYIGVNITARSNNISFNEYNEMLFLGNEGNKYTYLVGLKDKKSGITSIEIPKGVRHIGSYAFYGSMVSSVAFSGDGNLLGIGDSAFSRSAIQSAIIPDGVLYIGDSAFMACKKLEALSIPTSIEEIGEKVFLDAKESIYYKNDNALYLGNKNNNYLVLANITDKNILSYSFKPETKIIGHRALASLPSLTSITIPNTIKSISIGAFYDSNALSSIIFESDSTIKIIKERAFSNTAIVSIVLPNSIEIIEENAFCNSKITNIVLPENVYKIGAEAFSECEYLTSIAIPKGLKEIEASTFSDCPSLSIVSFEKNCALTTIGEKAFMNCTMLHNIEIPDSVVEIKAEAFYRSGLHNLSLSGSSALEKIGNAAFAECLNITNIVIPKNVTSIEKDAFGYCKKLVEIYNLSAIDFKKASNDMDNPLYYIDSYADINVYTKESGSTRLFIKNGCVFYTNTDNQIYLIDYIGTGSSLTMPVIEGKSYNIFPLALYSNATLETITVPEGVEVIGNEAFAYSKKLKKVTLPTSITTIEDFAFYECNFLRSLELYSGITSVGSNIVPYNLSIEQLTESDGALYLGSRDNAYSILLSAADTLITSVLINDSTEIIANKAFFGCTELLTLNFGTSGKLKYIGNESFKKCSALTSIAIPQSVKQLGISAFSGCTLLKSVSFAEDCQITAFSEQLFRDCEALENITIPKSVITIDSLTFYNAKALENILFIDDCALTEIGENAFIYCNTLSSIAIPRSVTKIGASAFGFCSGLLSISVDSQNTSYYVSGNCLIEKSTKTLIRGLNNSIIPSDGSVISIGSSAFSGYTGFDTIIIPSVITIIESDAFACTAIKTITIPASVEVIGRFAFSVCSLLESVIFEEDSKLKSIGEMAFNGCESLEKLDIPNSITY